MQTSFILVSALCTRLPFIRDLNVPSCVNCVNFIEYKRIEPCDNYDVNLGTCSKFGSKNMISGEIIYDFASICRIDRNRCGTKGIYYNPLPTNP